MITTEIHIAGSLYGVVNIVNAGPVQNIELGQAQGYYYNWQFYKPGNEMITGRVVHYRDNGIEKVIATVMEEIVSELIKAKIKNEEDMRKKMDDIRTKIENDLKRTVADVPDPRWSPDV